MWRKYETCQKNYYADFNVRDYNVLNWATGNRNNTAIN